MLRKILFTIIFLITIPAFAKTFIVERVINGDTIIVTTSEGNPEKVHLIGIDCPESQPNDKAKRDSERTGKDLETITKMGQPLDSARGKEAMEFVKRILELYKDWNIVLEFDVQERDKYGRLLAYVFIDTGIKEGEELRFKHHPGYYFNYFDGKWMCFINATIIKAGYATPMTIPPNVKYADLFKKLYEEAREQSRGLWKEESDEEPVACTMEAKLCPDGSAVGRVGPNCEFAACPE